jgi:hypothetical protein
LFYSSYPCIIAWIMGEMWGVLVSVLPCVFFVLFFLSTTDVKYVG